MVRAKTVSAGVILLASVVLAMSARSSTAAPAVQPSQGAGSLVLFHWWSTPSDLAALDALGRVVRAKHPGLAEKRAAAPAERGAELFRVLSRMSKAGTAPDAVSMTAGYAMKPFVDAGLLARLDDLWIAARLEKVIPPGIQSVNQFDGHYYAAPLGVHRTNLVWYNKRLLDRHGIDPTSLTTQEAFFDAAARLRAAGVRTPIQAAATWTMLPVFEGMMAAQGIGTYRDWVNGRIRLPGDPRLIQALGGLKRYVSFANQDRVGLDWLAALRRVAAGESAFYWMGDWANGDFSAAGLVYGRDYGAIVAPGTGGLYGVSIDAFVKPLGSAQPESANRWLRVATSREGQDAFNSRKGSIPARKDPNLSRYDAYQKSAIASFRASTPYPYHGAALPATYERALSRILEAFLADGDIRRAATALAAATDSSSFTRVWTPE